MNQTDCKAETIRQNSKFGPPERPVFVALVLYIERARKNRMLSQAIQPSAYYPEVQFPIKGRREGGRGGAGDINDATFFRLAPPRSNVSGSFSFYFVRFHSQSSINMSKDIRNCCGLNVSHLSYLNGFLNF